MGASTTMEKRGHHICKMVNYEVRQKVSKETSKRVGGKIVKTPGSVEVMIYQKKKQNRRWYDRHKVSRSKSLRYP